MRVAVMIPTSKGKTNWLDCVDKKAAAALADMWLAGWLTEMLVSIKMKRKKVLRIGICDSS